MAVWAVIRSMENAGSDLYLTSEEGKISKPLTIPQDDRIRSPSCSNLEISAFLDMIVKQLEQSIRLLILEANNLSTELTVYKEGFLASDWMSAYHRMNIFNGFSLDDASSISFAGVFGLSNS